MAGPGGPVPCGCLTCFLACLYRVCFRVSEPRVALSTSLTSKASSAALRRSSPFPKVRIGSKANRPPGDCSAHLHQRPRGRVSRPGRRRRLPACTSHMHGGGGIRRTRGHTDTRTEAHRGGHSGQGESCRAEGAKGLEGLVWETVVQPTMVRGPQGCVISAG